MKWADNVAAAPRTNTLLWQLYLIQHDCQNGMVYLEKSIAGRDATETELRQGKLPATTRSATRPSDRR